ncbi:MAG: cobyric acid synthase [Bryobacteraceae bacterium]
MRRARALMVGGTASHVGKSWMATAICRWLVRRGYNVAPFKAQNMSNNSYPCAAGGEIGRAQVAQAQACFLEPEPDMNPILLKPNSDCGSQVVVDGKVWKNLSAREYYEHFPTLVEHVLAAYGRLSERYEFVVVEGAGSIAELNLKRTDLVNMGLATRLRIPVLLVADIDRGGVFAAVAGTFSLLDEEERSLVRGFAVNRFRGDPTLFTEGVNILEGKTNKPCLGVFPHLYSSTLDAEDALSIESDVNSRKDSPVAIVRLPHVSNVSDFRLLPAACWISKPIPGVFDHIILPGTKNTIADLLWMHRTGLSKWILDQHAKGAHVVGICGGYQMLGEVVEDPFGVETTEVRAEGLKLVGSRTVLSREKTTRVVRATTPSGYHFEAYEIHMGQTTRPSEASAFATLDDGTEDGVRTLRCSGTYLHGALEDPAVLAELLGRSVPALPDRNTVYDELADWFDANVDRKRFEELYLC